MHAKLGRQLRQRLVALDRGECYLCLECCPMIPSRSLHRLAPLVRPPSGASVMPGYHLSHCPNFRGPFSRSCCRSAWAEHYGCDNSAGSYCNLFYLEKEMDHYSENNSNIRS